MKTQQPVTQEEIRAVYPLSAGHSTVLRFDPAWLGDPAVYCHPLAVLCAKLSLLGYRLPGPETEAGESGAEKAFRAIGAKTVKAVSGTAGDAVDCVLAAQKIRCGRKNYDLVICAAIGSHYTQWYSNFDAGFGTDHRGFSSAKQSVLRLLTDFLAETGAKKETTKLLFTGHSRGAAAANLLAAELIRNETLALRGNIYAYTFATPNPTLAADTGSAAFSGIFNLVNEEDFVTRCMPREWGYSRYGVTLALPNASTAADFDGLLKRMNAFYREYSGGTEYLCFKNGPKAVNTLFCTLCRSVKNVSDYYRKYYRCFGEQLSVREFFFRTVCAVTGEAAGTEKNRAGMALLIKTAALRLPCDPVLRKIAGFFVAYEGIGGATGGKISAPYFSFAHDMAAYCAFLEAIDESRLF